MDLIEERWNQTCAESTIDDYGPRPRLDRGKEKEVTEVSRTDSFYYAEYHSNIPAGPS